MPKSLAITRACAVLVCAFVLSAVPAAAAPPETVRLDGPHSFDALVSRLEEAIANHKMGLVAKASASAGAAARGETIAGNAVLLVFRNDYAVRMLDASVAAGIEAPLRLYVTELPGGRAAVSYRTPSTVFAPYGSTALDALAAELDAVFAGIVEDAIAP